MMTANPIRLTRRRFSQLLTASAASTLFGPSAHAATCSGFAHIASAANCGAIHTFRVSGSTWHPIQSLESLNPAHLELHPTLPVLYAVHDVPLWHYLPRGAISAYAIDRAAGHLTLLSTQPLSLATTNPRHAAIAPNGSFIAAASIDAGIYNILPIASDGALQPPTIIRKELNVSTTQTLSPHSLLVLPDSKTLLTINSCHQPVNAFTIEGDFLIPAANGRPLPTHLQPNFRIPARPPAFTCIDSPTSFLFRPA